jgi:hypothetical protein
MEVREGDDAHEGGTDAVIGRGPGDLLRAISGLDVEQWDRARRMLGFTAAESEVDEMAPAPVADVEGVASAMAPTGAIAAHAAAPGDEVRLTSRPVSRTVPTDVGDVEWLAEVQPLARPIAGAATSGLRHQPLLDPRREAALLAELVSTTLRSGRPDIGQLIRVVTTRRPIRAIPRRARPTLSQGVQILLDLGLGLRPFVEDRDHLEAALHRVVGSTLVKVAWFTDDLSSDVFLDEGDDPAPYALPPPGVPVLIVSDLGIGGGSLRTQWPRVENLVELSDQLRARGSFLCALAPFSRSRWPAGLDRRLVLVPWDRRTTMATVRAARQAGGVDHER